LSRKERKSRNRREYPRERGVHTQGVTGCAYPGCDRVYIPGWCIYQVVYIRVYNLGFKPV